MKGKLLQQLFEIFYILQLQERIASTETIRGNTVNDYRVTNEVLFNCYLIQSRQLIVLIVKKYR